MGAVNCPDIQNSLFKLISKELIEYGEQNLHEISCKMGYSSSANLSTQIKAITGLSTSQFKSDYSISTKLLDKLYHQAYVLIINLSSTINDSLRCIKPVF